MIRTQISLTEHEYLVAKRTARQLGISLAALLRRALQTILPMATGPVTPAKPWMHYAGLVTSGNARSSETIDDVIYGQKD